MRVRPRGLQNFGVQPVELRLVLANVLLGNAAERQLEKVVDALEAMGRKGLATYGEALLAQVDGVLAGAAGCAPFV